jgi:small subunit ribosomal protein S5
MAENIAQVEVKSEKPAKNFMRKRFHDEKREAPEFEERVIEVSRVARTVKGGRSIRFRALVVIGNHKGKIGMGLGKSNDVSEAVK